MNIPTDKPDETVLALRFLRRHAADRAWKRFDWDVLGHRYEQGYRSDPVSKAKLARFTEDKMA